MSRWFEGPLAAFDTETTGLDVERDRIVSAALVVQAAPGVAPRTRTWLVDPGVPVPREATAIHGFTGAHLRDHGRPPALMVARMAHALAEQVGHGVPLVVMNAPFDLTLLDRELRRHQRAPLADYLSTRPLCVLDPRVLDRHVDHSREGRRALTDLCAHYAVELRRAHDAAADALAALEVVRAVGRRFTARLGSLTLPQLHARQALWHAARARGCGAWFSAGGSRATGDPAWPLRWRRPGTA
ncbi:exonuclease domain-containing protein [Streptomyces sp. NPDC057702]|uniref:exonuclease domain-containing protein n=1 Tax=unclassified Streptomyces TaxID=2593676 RepID=UPI0036C2951E